MIDLTQDAIQILLDHPKGQGMIVSCYADTSMTGTFQWLWSQRLKNEASVIEHRLKDDHEAGARFVRNLEIIGEAASRLPTEFVQQHADIAWEQIVGLRHRIVHDYFGIDLKLVWQILQHDLPAFQAQLAALP